MLTFVHSCCCIEWMDFLVCYVYHCTPAWSPDHLEDSFICEVQVIAHIELMKKNTVDFIELCSQAILITICMHNKQRSSQRKCREHLSNLSSYCDNATHQSGNLHQPAMLWGKVEWTTHGMDYVPIMTMQHIHQGIFISQPDNMGISAWNDMLRLSVSLPDIMYERKTQNKSSKDEEPS